MLGAGKLCQVCALCSISFRSIRAALTMDCVKWGLFPALLQICKQKLGRASCCAPCRLLVRWLLRCTRQGGPSQRLLLLVCQACK